jgi:hypothetical protein
VEHLLLSTSAAAKLLVLSVWRHAVLLCAAEVLRLLQIIDGTKESVPNRVPFVSSSLCMACTLPVSPPHECAARCVLVHRCCVCAADRYVAQRAGLLPSDPWKVAQADQAYFFCEDVWQVRDVFPA